MQGQLTSRSDLGRWQRPVLILTAVGLVLAGVGAFLDLEQFWQSYLLAYIFWIEIGLGCLGVIMVHHLVGGRWSASIRHVMETGAMTLPLMALLFIPLLFGLSTLYPWLDAEHVLESELLQAKSAYLNLPFFLGRSALYFVVWVGLAFLLNRWSVRQEEPADGAATVRLQRLSAVGIILYVLTATFAGYDWMMSLEPEWFSSIYGLLFIAGQALAALALAILGLRFISTPESELSEEEAEKEAEQRTGVFNDLGNFLLGFVMIWAYFSFSQFLIIWSADIPEEAIWYYRRSRGGWLGVGMVLVTFHFVLPFLVLLSRRVKRRAQWLAALALLIFVTRLVDLFWLIVPAFYPDGLHIHWLDPMLLVGMGGLWVTVFAWQWRGR